MAELENWVVLRPGVPTRLHFKAHRMVERTITDAIFEVTRTVRSMLFLVDEEDDVPVDKTFSVLSQRLMNDLAGYLEADRYLLYTFTLIKDAPGTVPPRLVEVTPR